jgi:hypothetical protein
MAHLDDKGGVFLKSIAHEDELISAQQRPHKVRDASAF